MADAQASPDALWKTLDLVTKSVQLADTKAGTILFIDGVFATLVTARLVDAHDLLHGNHAFIGVVVIGAMLWLVSVYYSVMCLRPRLNNVHGQSLIFFADIARTFPTDFHEYELAASDRLSTPGQVASQVAEQVWANALVADQKHADVTKSLTFLICAVVLAIAVALLFVIGNVV